MSQSPPGTMPTGVTSANATEWLDAALLHQPGVSDEALETLALAPQPETGKTLFRSADTNEWLDAADQHRPGADDEPLRKIASWTGSKLMRALAVIRESPSSDATNARLERAALLHADISIARRK